MWPKTLRFSKLKLNCASIMPRLGGVTLKAGLSKRLRQKNYNGHAVLVLKKLRLLRRNRGFRSFAIIVPTLHILMFRCAVKTARPNLSSPLRNNITGMRLSVFGFNPVRNNVSIAAGRDEQERAKNEIGNENKRKVKVINNDRTKRCRKIWHYKETIK